MTHDTTAPSDSREIQRLRAENRKLALLLGRRMTPTEIGSVLSRAIDRGDLVIPPIGSPVMTTEQVAEALGINLGDLR